MVQILEVLCVQEVVTHFIIVSYYIKWVTTSWTYITTNLDPDPGVQARSTTPLVYVLIQNVCLVHGTYVRWLLRTCCAYMKEIRSFLKKIGFVTFLD